MPLHGVFRGILKGWQERGEGGFLFVNGKEECAYCFPSELTNLSEEAREGIRAALEQGGKRIFLVAQEKKESGQLEVRAYERDHVFSSVAQEMAASSSSSTTTSSETLPNTVEEVVGEVEEVGAGV